MTKYQLEQEMYRYSFRWVFVLFVKIFRWTKTNKVWTIALIEDELLEQVMGYRISKMHSNRLNTTLRISIISHLQFTSHILLFLIAAAWYCLEVQADGCNKNIMVSLYQSKYRQLAHVLPWLLILLARRCDRARL